MIQAAEEQTGHKAVVLVDEYDKPMLDVLGTADVIIETNNDVFIFEFKLDGSVEEVLKQIEEKQYAVPYLDDKRKIHKIGVNISSETRTVDGWLVADK